MSLAGCQIIPIDLNFSLQKCLEIFDKNSADKIQFKNSQEVNLPCLIPIRVNRLFHIYVGMFFTFSISPFNSLFICFSIYNHNFRSQVILQEYLQAASNFDSDLGRRLESVKKTRNYKNLFAM